MKPGALEWVARFRRYMNSERRLSAHTDSNYARDLAALVKYCDRSGLEEWSALDTQHIRVFAAHSHAGGLSPRSVQRRLSAVRSFYEFLIKENQAPRSVSTAAGEPAAHQATREQPSAGDAVAGEGRSRVSDAGFSKSQRRPP